MDEQVRSIYWKALEHNHTEKTADWYWALGIVAVIGSVTSIILNNVLFGIVILLAAILMFLTGNKKPRMIDFEVSARGVRVEDRLYPYATLECYYLDEENRVDPQLLVKSKKMFGDFLIIPVPVEYVEIVEDMVASRLPEEHLTEPFAHVVLEFFGF